MFLKFYQSIDWILFPANGNKNDLLCSNLMIPTELVPSVFINKTLCPSLENFGNWFTPLEVNLFKLSDFVEIRYRLKLLPNSLLASLLLKITLFPLEVTDELLLLWKTNLSTPLDPIVWAKIFGFPNLSYTKTILLSFSTNCPPTSIPL